jgi:UvrD-like helicase C-terminal domain
MLQELLAEEASELIICVLRLAMTMRAGRHWTECQEALGALRGIGPDDEVEQARFAKALDAYARRLARDYPAPPTIESAARKLVDDVLGFIDRGRLVAIHPAYGQGDWLEKVLASTATHLAQSATMAIGWTDALDVYEGLHAISLMTIHKSKGLEYHTVIFVGLDDGAWWSFAGDQVEATAGFFVAFTRAKQRVVFTYCAQRGTRTKIATLYELLAQAGVRTFKID